MKDPLQATDDIYTVLKALSLPDEVYKDRKPDTAAPDVTSYYVVKPLTIDADQLQEGVIIVNLHSANLSATKDSIVDPDIPNRTKLKQMLAAVLPTLDNSLINNMATKVQNITQFAGKGETEVSIRIFIYSINL